MSARLLEEVKRIRDARRVKAERALDQLSRDGWYGSISCPQTGALVMNNRKRFEESWGCGEVQRGLALIMAHKLKEDGFEGRFDNNNAEPIVFIQDEMEHDSDDDDHVVPGRDLLDFLEAAAAQGANISFIPSHKCAECEEDDKKAEK